MEIMSLLQYHCIYQNSNDNQDGIDVTDGVMGYSFNNNCSPYIKSSDRTWKISKGIYIDTRFSPTTVILWYEGFEDCIQDSYILKTKGVGLTVIGLLKKKNWQVNSNY